MWVVSWQHTDRLTHDLEFYANYELTYFMVYDEYWNENFNGGGYNKTEYVYIFRIICPGKIKVVFRPIM